MSSKIFYTLEDAEFLESYELANLRAIRDSFGRITGYESEWYNNYKNLVANRKQSFYRNFNSRFDRLDQMNRNLGEIQMKQMENFERKLQANINQFNQMLDQQGDLSAIRQVTKKAMQEQNEMIESVSKEMMEQFNLEVKQAKEHTIKQIESSMNQVNGELQSLQNDIQRRKEVAMQYATDAFSRLQQTFDLMMKEFNDARYVDQRKVAILQTTMNNVQISMQQENYEGALALASTTESNVMQMIYEMCASKKLYEEKEGMCKFHLNYLIHLMAERRKVQKDVIDAVNQYTNGKKLKMAMTKKDLFDYSPDHQLEKLMNELADISNQLATNTLSMEEISALEKQLQAYYPTIQNAFDDALMYRGNYLERMTFANHLIQSFEEAGRTYQGWNLGEEQNCTDYTQPIFVYFTNEGSGAEFMIEIYAKHDGSKLESEFHVHKLNGDPLDQFENEDTENLVKQALADPSVFMSGGCDQSSINQLSNDPRLLNIRKLVHR